MYHGAVGHADDTLLARCRVLDCTGVFGSLAGKLLGDLGADVVKVEPPGGDAGRRTGPFAGDRPHPHNSLSWEAFNANKRGITLALDNIDGRALFRALASEADIVIEDWAPGRQDSLGIGYRSIARDHPRVVWASITPFGATGPRSGYRATDLVLMALGGSAYLTGDADRPPLRCTLPLSHAHAGAEAAAACLLTLSGLASTGQGQHIDVSMQETVAWTTMDALPMWWLERRDMTRGRWGRYNEQTGVWGKSVWRCKDGYVTFGLYAGPARGRGTRAIVEWMAGEGRASPALRAIDWTSPDAAPREQASYDSMAGEVEAFFETKSVAELYEQAARDRVLLAPICTAEQVLGSPQLTARGYFRELEEGVAPGARYPGYPVRMAGLAIGVRRRAPRPGEHNVEIYCGELGITRAELATLKAAGAL